jgi:hypothetical protein
MIGLDSGRRIASVSVLAFALGLGLAQAALAADSSQYTGLMGDPMTPLAPAPQLRQETFPWGPYSGPGRIPAVSVYRDGSGFVVDPRNGLPISRVNGGSLQGG